MGSRSMIQAHFKPPSSQAKFEPEPSLLSSQLDPHSIYYKLIATLLVKSEDCYLCLKFEIPLDAVDGLEGLVVITCKRPYNDNLNCGFIRNL